ncbi:SipW-dependent-type signal peptide-containing protein [Oscillospiraceae bacterium HCP3S3_F4]
MKKKLTAIFLCVALVAIAVVGASLAYFTDTKTATNTFTVGNVKIDLIEQQKGANGLEDFVPNKTLLPGTSDKNAVSKIVTVKNTGENDAWVWVDLKIPAYLVSNEYPTNESKNALHWNSYGCFNVEYNSGNYWGLATSDGIVDADHKVTNPDMVAVGDGLWHDYQFVDKETIGDTEYVVIRTKMKNKLPAGKISLPCLAQVYMDWRVVTDKDGTQFILPAGDPISTDASWEIIVNAYAIQADGFDNVDEAIAGYTNNGK